MTLQDFKKKYSYTYDDLEAMTGRRRSELHRWLNEGATVSSDDSRLLEIVRQPKTLWSACDDT